MIIAPQERGLWCMLTLGSMLLCITSFLVVGIFTENQSQKSFHYSPGLMKRAEAFSFFIAMMIWPAIIRLVQFYNQQYDRLAYIANLFIHALPRFSKRANFYFK